MGYRAQGDSSRMNFTEWDLINILYSDRFGEHDSGERLPCVRKTGAFVGIIFDTREDGGPFVDRRAKLSNLAIGTVAIQKDILDGQLGIIDITNGDRERFDMSWIWS